jgi:hypothetical protein
MDITYSLYVNVSGATQQRPLLLAFGGVQIPG